MQKNALFEGMHLKRNNLTPVKAKRRYRHSEARFADTQMLTLLKKHRNRIPRLSIWELYGIAQKEMPKFYSADPRDYDKVKNAINRLVEQGKIDTDKEIRGDKLCRIITLR